MGRLRPLSREGLPKNSTSARSTFCPEPQDFTSNIDKYANISHWVQAAAAARRLGMNVYSFDAPFDPHGGCDDAEMEVRNDFISGALQTLIHSGICKKVVMITGTLQLVQNVPGVLEHIPSKLNKMGLKTHSVFVASGTGMRINRELIPPMCLDLFKSKSAVVDTKKARDMFDWEWRHENEREEILNSNGTSLIFRDRG